MRSLVLAAVIALVAPVAGIAASAGQPAAAVIGGRPDGNEHPNVGLIVGLNSDGIGVYSCTGTLVNPTTVLTAAHCVGGLDFGEPIARIVIDFDSAVEMSAEYVPSVYVEGTGDPNPLFHAVNGGSSKFLADSAFDVGLLHLAARADAVFPGIQPAAITLPGTNDQYRTGPKKDLLLQVGYGVQRDGPPGQATSYFIDYTRNQSLVQPKKVTDALLFTGGNPNNAIGYGSPCGGDSGSPVFRADVVVSIHTFGQSTCQNIGGGPRLDSGPARDFLRLRGVVA